MAEITVRRRGELMKRVIEVLRDHPEGLPAKEVLKHVANSLPLTDFEQSTYPNNPTVRRFEKIVRDPSLKTRPFHAGNSMRPAARFGPLVRQTLGA